MQATLDKFLSWFLHVPVGILEPPRGGPGPVILDNQSVLTMCLFRQPPFQVELVVLKPGSAPWPGEHRHPHVDSYEVDLYNNWDFTKNGLDVTQPEFVVPVSLNNGFFSNARAVRLLPSDWHGARCRPEGAALFSVQQWADGVTPTSVGLDWEGQPVDASHQLQQETYASR